MKEMAKEPLHISKHRHTYLYALVSPAVLLLSFLPGNGLHGRIVPLSDSADAPRDAAKVGPLTEETREGEGMEGMG